MSTREQLNQYLRGLESRLRLLVVSKGAAIALGVALGATIALVLITNALAFSDTSVTVARVVLFIALAVSLGFALIVPLLRLNQRGAAGKAEAACPEFDARLVTYVERSDKEDPFIDLLAADTLEKAADAPLVRVVPQKSIFAFATGAGAAGAVLLWLILAGPGYLGYGANLLWAGPLKAGPNGSGGYYQINVDPGDKTVRRKSDLRVTATLSGFQAPLVRLMAKYQSAAKWEEAPMVPRANGTAYEFLFAAIPEPVEYYVEAAGVKSKSYKIGVVDLPGIKKIKVTYHFPSWLGMKDAVEDPGGDLRAVAGTVAELNIETDRPLKNGVLEMEDGSKINLEPRDGNIVTAKVNIERDGIFHYSALENGENVRLSEDYFIEAREDGAPSVKVVHPGADAKVSPIEEVTVEVQASDDFGLTKMDLHYSVNGGPEKVVSLLNAPGRDADGKTTLYLEDFHMQPGDVVAMYATAKDARIESKTDMAFIEAQPFEKNYSQSQQMGGGGGGGGGQQDQEEISRRQKEIIAATWNAIRGGKKDRSASAENAEFLSEVQAKLRDQATSLAQRATSRQLAGANQEFQSFTKDMQEAAAQMGPASEKLKAQKWQEALEPEQKALQHLLRAEATFRDIQVAFGNQGGGGGGGGSAGRDLANLFDLELDTEKNQYEQGQSGASSQEQRQKDIDEALQKLEQLARRQQELAQQQRNAKQQTPEQRYQQELLRREAEELRKQMEQLSQQQQSGQLSRNSQSSSNSQSGQSGRSGQQSQSGQQSAQNRQQPRGADSQRLQSALDRLRQATDDMRNAQQASQNGQSDNAQTEAAARRAAERLQEARDMVNNMRRQDASSALSDLGDRADQIAQRQKDTENQLKQAYGNQGADPRAPRGAQSGPGLNRQQANELASEKERILNDLDKLERDLQRSARELANSQPNASARLRDGLAEIQQNEAKLRLKYQADYIRQGMGQYMVPREAPITNTLDKLREDIRQAQQAMKDGDQQAQGANDLERQLSRVERMRQQLEQMAGRNGSQQGQNGQQQGQSGQQGGNQQGGQQAGNQQGGNQQGGGNQGGNQYGGRNNPGQYGARPFGGNAGAYGYNGGPYDPRDYFGRYNPEGVYQAQDARPLDPREMSRDFARELAEMRQMFKDDPDMSRSIADLQSEITKLNFGDPSGPELQQRLSRTILPQLETLEVQLRRQAAEEDGGQVRSGASDRVPAGFVDSVAEYFRKLSRGK